MSKEEADNLGLGDAERLSYFPFDSAKANMAVASRTEWFRLVGVSLGNGTPEYPNGDVVQTVERWEPTGEFRDLGPEAVRTLCEEIETSDPPFTMAAQSPRWLGKRVMEVAGISREAVARTVKSWMERGFIKIGSFKNKDGNTRAGINLAISVEEMLGRMSRRG